MTLPWTHHVPFQPILGSQSLRKGRLAHYQSVRATQRKEALASLPLPDGNLGLPLIGETLQLLSQGDTFGAERTAQHGNMWKTNILGSPTVMVFGEEDCRRLLKEEGNLVEVIWPDVTAELVGTASLNLLKGEEHLRLKKTLGDAFSEEAVEALRPTLQECTRLFCKRWAGMGSFSAYDESKLWAWTVFGAGVLGLPATVETGERLCSLMDDLQGGFQTAPVKLPLTPYQKAVSARESIVQIVQQQMDAISGGAGLKGCCLANMMADEQLTAAQVIDNIIAAAFGNASAGPTAAKAFQHLAAGPAREGIAGELRGVGDSSRHPLQELEYTNAVVREMLRITPIVPALFRRALKDFELSGRLVPKGWSVYIHTGASVQKYNQDSFQPQRWLEQGIADRKSSTAAMREQSASSSGGGDADEGSSAGQEDAAAAKLAPSESARSGCPEHSLPFGLGPRMCLGRHIVKAALVLLVAELVSKHEWQMGNSAEQWLVFPTVRPKEGLRVSNFIEG